MPTASISLAAAALAIGAAFVGPAHANTLPPDLFLAELPAKKVPPTNAGTTCYYTMQQCADSPRLGRICWRKTCSVRQTPVTRPIP